MIIDTEQINLKGTFYPEELASDQGAVAQANISHLWEVVGIKEHEKLNNFLNFIN